MPNCYQDLIDAGFQAGKEFSVSTGNLGKIGQCLLISPHAGSIEPGTGELMYRIAMIDGRAYYSFEGHLPVGNWRRLHIPSERFDEPTLLGLLTQTPFVVSFHGKQGNKQRTILVGGRFENGRDVIFEELGEICRELGIDLIDAVRDGTPRISGADERNITNRGKSGVGIQLEISAGARRLLFESLTRRRRTRPNASLDQFAGCINRALGSLTGDNQ